MHSLGIFEHTCKDVLRKLNNFNGIRLNLRNTGLHSHCGNMTFAINFSAQSEDEIFNIR